MWSSLILWWTWYNVCMKTCVSCNRDFVPSSRHRMCPTCRRNKYKHKCLDCDNLVGRIYTRCVRCSNQIKPGKNGGVIKHKAGYRMVRVPEHPRQSNGYVFEHIIIMENMLGRRLVSGETVHHLNGIKDDNRPENLELWVRPQPSGIRASDALAWAYRIIELYGGEHLLQQTSSND